MKKKNRLKPKLTAGARLTRIKEIVVELAKPEDFTIEKKERKLYVMDNAIDTVTQYQLRVYDSDSNITYTLGCYSTEQEAERVMRQTIRRRKLPAFKKLTLRDIAEAAAGAAA